MTQVKICGNTNTEDVRSAIELGADFIGFIFSTASKRCLSAEAAKEIMVNFPEFHGFVGVFLNQPKREAETLAEQLGIKILQFHGEETARYADYFMSKGYWVIKTFHIKDKMSMKRLDEYNVTSFMFDTYQSGQKGGTGVAFDWNLIEDKPYVHEKLFLAGGLTPESVGEAVRKIAPFAVDVASGVESAPGKKDPEKLRRFIEAARGGKPEHHRHEAR